MRGRSLAAAALATAIGFSPALPAQAAPSSGASAGALSAGPRSATDTPAAGRSAADTPAAGRSAAGVSALELRLARQTLAADDGWAAAGTGTTGGSAADAAHTFVVHNRAELVAALSGPAAPRIVFVDGRLSMGVDADNKPLSCADYADPGYDLAAFRQAYDPAVWGRAAKPSGPLEEARARSAKRQGDQIKINVPSDTTVIGINGARISHGSMVIGNVHNVIVRNIEFTDAADCFPAWDPTDGATGNWNSLYDLVSLTGATNVWLDHNTFSDGNNHDADQPVYFDRPYQVHDGASDIIRGSDLVTVSYNNYYDHDKTMLIGSTDTPGVDVGKLRVTLHHNRFGNVIQRAPRVRFGQVDIYDNLYVATDEEYGYSLGVGFESSIYAENNYFVRSADVGDGNLIKNWKGTRITAKGTLVQVGSRLPRPVDLVAAHNAAYDPDFTPDAGWVPTLRSRLDPTLLVPVIVKAAAGSRRLGI